MLFQQNRIAVDVTYCREWFEIKLMSDYCCTFLSLIHYKGTKQILVFWNINNILYEESGSD